MRNGRDKLRKERKNFCKTHWYNQMEKSNKKSNKNTKRRIQKAQLFTCRIANTTIICHAYRNNLIWLATATASMSHYKPVCRLFARCANWGNGIWLWNQAIWEQRALRNWMTISVRCVTRRFTMNLKGWNGLPNCFDCPSEIYFEF